MIQDYLTPEAKCVNCGKAMDGATPATGGRGPQPGDISICLDCHHVAAYGADMQLRALTEEEVVELAGDQELLAAMRLLERYKAWKRAEDG